MISMKKTLASLLAFAAVTDAAPPFQALIPNGAVVMHEGVPWPAVGHLAGAGGPGFNAFGLDFQAAGLQWTVELCQKDSDMDGRTNGEELGDPDCVWSVDGGAPPARTTDISHPGFETVFDEDESDMMTAESTPAVGDSQQQVEQLSLPTWLVAHIVLMMLSWGFVLPLGALMATSFRGLLQKNALWFKLHIALQLTGVALSIAGFVVAFTNIATHFKDTHQILGTVVFAGGLFQAVQGMIRPHKPEKDEQPTMLRKVWEVCHKGFGPIVTILAWANIFLGVKLIKSFFEGVPENMTSTVITGMNVILGVQAVLCLVVTVVSVFYRSKPSNDHNDKAREDSEAMKTTKRNDDLEEQGSE